MSERPSKRLRDTVISKAIVVGNITYPQPKSGAHLADGYKMHDWALYVRGVNHEDLSYFISSVEFELDPSFLQPHRVVNAPGPFVLVESGWGEFVVTITIHFIDNIEKPVTLYHSIRLYDEDHPPPSRAAAAAASTATGAGSSASGDASSAASDHAASQKRRKSTKKTRKDKKQDEQEPSEHSPEQQPMHDPEQQQSQQQHEAVKAEPKKKVLPYVMNEFYDEIVFVHPTRRMYDLIMHTVPQPYPEGMLAPKTRQMLEPVRAVAAESFTDAEDLRAIELAEAEVTSRLVQLGAHITDLTLAEQTYKFHLARNARLRLRRQISRANLVRQMQCQSSNHPRGLRAHIRPTGGARLPPLPSMPSAVAPALATSSFVAPQQQHQSMAAPAAPAAQAVPHAQTWHGFGIMPHRTQ